MSTDPMADSLALPRPNLSERSTPATPRANRLPAEPALRAKHALEEATDDGDHPLAAYPDRLARRPPPPNPRAALNALLAAELSKHPALYAGPDLRFQRRAGRRPNL